jgi:hypothetical protein
LGGDAELLAVIDAWPGLPQAVRAAIVALAKAASTIEPRK